MQPHAVIFGVTIAEPVTTLTDYLLAAICVAFAVRLWMNCGGYRSRRLWAIALFCTGLGAFLGGTSHGFAPHLDALARTVIWKSTVYTIGASAFLALCGTVAGTRLSRRWRSGLNVYNGIAFAVYVVVMSIESDFRYVILYYVPALLVVASLQAHAYAGHRAKSAPWLIAGVASSFIAAAIQQSGIELHPHFNHNDLYHVVQAVALWFLYRGARELEDAVPERGAMHPASG